MQQTFGALAKPHFRARIELAVVLALCALTAVFVLMDLDSPLRVVVGAAFLCFAPGLPFVRLAGVTAPAALIALTIAASLALDGLVAIAVLYANLWSPMLVLIVLMLVTMVGCAVCWMRLRALLVGKRSDSSSIVR
jgi:hypothetical protein